MLRPKKIVNKKVMWCLMLIAFYQKEIVISNRSVINLTLQMKQHPFKFIMFCFSCLLFWCTWKNDLTILYTAWALAVPIIGSRPHLSPSCHVIIAQLIYFWSATCCKLSIYRCIRTEVDILLTVLAICSHHGRHYTSAVWWIIHTAVHTWLTCGSIL